MRLRLSILSLTYVIVFLWDVNASLNDGVTEFYDAEDGPVHMIVSGSVIVSDEQPLRSLRSFIPKRHKIKKYKKHKTVNYANKTSKIQTQQNNDSTHSNGSLESVIRSHSNVKNITINGKQKHIKKHHGSHFKNNKHLSQRGSVRDEIPNKSAQKKTIYPPPSNMWAINKELSDTEHSLQEKGELGESSEKEGAANHSDDIVLHAEEEKDEGKLDGRADAIPRPGVQEDLRQVLLAKGTVPKYVSRNNHHDSSKNNDNSVFEPGQQIDKDEESSRKTKFQSSDRDESSKEDSSESFDDVPHDHKPADEIHKALSSFSPKEENSVEENGSLMHGKDSQNEIKQHSHEPDSQEKNTDSNDLPEGSLLKPQHSKQKEDEKESSVAADLNSSVDREIKHLLPEHKKKIKEEKDSPKIIYPGPSFPELKRRKQLERQNDRQQVQIIPKKTTNFVKNERNDFDSSKENEKQSYHEHPHRNDNNDDKTIDLDNEKPVSAVKNDDNQITISADAQDSHDKAASLETKSTKSEPDSTPENLHGTKESFNFDQTDSELMDQSPDMHHGTGPEIHPTKESDNNVKKDNSKQYSSSNAEDLTDNAFKPSHPLPEGVRLLRKDGKPASDQEILNHARAIMREQNKHQENPKVMTEDITKHISKFATSKPVVNQNSKEPFISSSSPISHGNVNKQMTGCKKGEFRCNNFIVQDSVERIDPSQMDNPEFNKVTSVPAEPNPMVAQHQPVPVTPQLEQPQPMQETPDLSVSKQDIGTTTLGSTAGFSKEELDAFDKQILKTNDGAANNQPIVSNPVPVSAAPPAKPLPNPAANHAAYNNQVKPQAPVVQGFQPNQNQAHQPVLPPAIQQQQPPAPAQTAAPVNPPPPQANVVPPARVAQVAAPPQPQLNPAQPAYPQISAAQNGGVKIAQGANGQHDPLKDITINTEGDTGHGNRLGNNQIILHTWSVEDPNTAHTKVIAQDQAPYPGMAQKPIQAIEKPPDVIGAENIAMQPTENNGVENKATFIKDDQHGVDQFPAKAGQNTPADFYNNKQAFAPQDNGIFAPKGSISTNNNAFPNQQQNNAFAPPTDSLAPEALNTPPAANEPLPSNNNNEKVPNNDLPNENSAAINPVPNSLQETGDAFASSNDIASSNVKFDNAALAMPNTANMNAANQAESTAPNKVDFANNSPKDIDGTNDGRIINLPDLQVNNGNEENNEIAPENAGMANNNQQIDGVPIGTAQDDPANAAATNAPNPPPNTAFAEVPQASQADIQAATNSLDMLPLVSNVKETASNVPNQQNNPQSNPKFENINPKANAAAIPTIKNSLEMEASAARIVGPSSAKLQPKDITNGFSQWPAGVNPGAQYSTEMIDLWKAKGIAPERGYLRGKIQEKKHRSLLSKKYAYRYGKPVVQQTVMSVLKPKRPTGPSIAYDQAFPENQFAFSQSKSKSKSKASKNSAESSASNSNSIKDGGYGAATSTKAKTGAQGSKGSSDKSGYGYGSGSGYGYGAQSWGWGGGGGWAGSPPPAGMPSPGDFSRSPQGVPNFPSGNAASAPASAAPQQSAGGSAPAAPQAAPAAPAAQATYTQPQQVKPPKINDKLKEKYNQKNKGKPYGKAGKAVMQTAQFKNVNQAQNIKLRKIKYNVNRNNRAQVQNSKNNSNLKKPKGKR